MKRPYKISIIKELKNFIIPLSKDEFDQLEKNILKEGCRDPLTVWAHNSVLILVDGHNRYKICQKHQIDFRITKISFETIEEVKAWMVDNQVGRRNLTPDQLSYYRGLKYLSLKNKKGGYANVKSKGQNELLTSRTLAEQFNVSESTVKRDAKFAEGLNIIGRSNPQLKIDILTGNVKTNKTDIQTLAGSRYAEKIIIKGGKDLEVKAKKIRDELLEDYERNLNKLRALPVVAEDEPIFLSKDDRIRKLKGKIISAINRAIRDRDEEAISELKKLVDKLSNEIF